MATNQKWQPVALTELTPGYKNTSYMHDYFFLHRKIGQARDRPHNPPTLKYSNKLSSTMFWLSDLEHLWTVIHCCIWAEYKCAVWPCHWYQFYYVGSRDFWESPLVTWQTHDDNTSLTSHHTCQEIAWYITTSKHTAWISLPLDKPRLAVFPCFQYLKLR